MEEVSSLSFTVPGGSWLLICVFEVQCSLVKCGDFASMEGGAATPCEKHHLRHGAWLTVIEDLRCAGQFSPPGRR